MTVELGHFALALALGLAVAQFVVPLWGALRGDARLMSVASGAATGQFVFVALAFGALVEAHAASDFSVRNVYENSHTLKPLIYKITGVWGSHEGSMLLWILILALFGAMVARGARGGEAIRSVALSLQGALGAAFIAFVLATSDPFQRLWPAPREGQDLNPLLQDPGLAIHPPLLYLGYVGFSVAFSFAGAALILGRFDAAWTRAVRPWALLAWTFLTLGIAMGSYWAYYTLGWGGFWFWDPVENASLMPWLAGTAFLHSAIVMEKREALKVWTVFLAILAFSLSLLGTFLVRSGVLTSVHAFAEDPRRGVFILAIEAFFIGGAFALFALRAPALKQGAIFAPLSREGFLVANNVLLFAACVTVVVGTLYPLVLQATTGQKITVGAPYFNTLVGALFAGVCLLLPFGHQLAWKRGDLLGVTQRLAVVALAAVAAALVLGAAHGFAPATSVIAAGLAIFVALGAFLEIGRRAFGGGFSPALVIARTRGLPLAAWAAFFAHLGFGIG
ncbi:MAG: heme lyase CcmF/NrfE family subunit, partial [Hyphomicrobiales bacterium]|nr:heme lyase CcmF/NrfE family subunit [Hyphomicrobiales bacterium]